MATFRRDTSGFTVRESRETLQVEAWGDNSVRVRSTLGPCITETPGSALTEPGPAQFSVEISDDRARMRNGDLVVQPARSCSARVSPISLPPHNADMHQPAETFTAVRSRSTLSRESASMA
jgi:hypothetical protein